jgi:hypothetical protein
MSSPNQSSEASLDCFAIPFAKEFAVLSEQPSVNRLRVLVNPAAESPSFGLTLVSWFAFRDYWFLGIVCCARKGDE